MEHKGSYNVQNKVFPANEGLHIHSHIILQLLFYCYELKLSVKMKEQDKTVHGQNFYFNLSLLAYSLSGNIKRSLVPSHIRTGVFEL
jgi:hypothetical protein